eukprot:TRINITY_DN1565_c0_g1_i1.p1 TRINITY_DN1565_c0_g1~~TRINITY_DN1565_c0_g1_i1.p1  ORF type:complete len:303 (+),score=49.51 TRINITY_DN1565_c0_g1_i1:21-929(+)
MLLRGSKATGTRLGRPLDAIKGAARTRLWYKGYSTPPAETATDKTKLETPPKKRLETAFSEIKLEKRYPLWSQNMNALLFSRGKLSLVPFIPSYLVGSTVPEVHTMIKNVEYAYKSLTDRFAEHDLEGMMPHLGEWAGRFLEIWKKHCDANNLTWELKSQYIVNSTGFSRAVLAVPNSMTDPELISKIQSTTSKNILSQLLKSRSSSVDVYAVYSVLLTVEETWKLKEKNSQIEVFTSPQHRPNHHIWKMGALIKKDQPPQWKIIDMDANVSKAFNTIGTQQEILNNYSVPNLPNFWMATTY